MVVLAVAPFPERVRVDPPGLGPRACSGPAPTPTFPDIARTLPGTTGLETTWNTPTGWMTVHDLLVVDKFGMSRWSHYRRAPADLGATGVLLRIATCVSGRVRSP